MIATQNLVQSIEQAHSKASGLLRVAAAMESVSGQPRKGFERADTFLDATSRHLNAVESVLLPVAQKHLTDGDLVSGYVRASKELEAALVSVKGREYGSAYAASLRWSEVWGSVRERLDRQQGVETELVKRLWAELTDSQEADLVERLERGETKAPSRPHPHAPHLGLLGLVSRRFLHLVDAFWDTAEGRMAPEQDRPARKKPGLLGQYFLADPRFDEDD